MNKHIFWDKLSAGLASATQDKYKFFSQSIESAGYKKFLEDTSLAPTSLKKGIQEVETNTSVGKLDPAYSIAQWKGKGYPTIIYHHGNNERPFDFSRFAKNSFKKIFIDSSEPLDVNLISIRAAFHNCSLRDYQKKISHLSNFVGMLSVSVKLIEALVILLKKEQESPILISGISLGGWVTNLHRSFYNSADAYVPLLAGAALDHLFTDSAYRKMGGRIARQNPGKIQQVLNFEEDFQKTNYDNVFPLLGRYDQYIQYERQRKSYQTDKIKVLEAGHITSYLKADELNLHIREVMENEAIKFQKTYTQEQLVDLPKPVQRYFRYALTDKQPYVSTLRLKHGGTFRLSPDKDWMEIRGEQHFTADPPGFVWKGKTKLFKASDSYVDGKGNLSVYLLGFLRIVKKEGKTINQAELLRWLGESVWMPTNLLPDENKQWTAIDDNSAKITFNYNGQCVFYIVTFNEKGQIERMETDRYKDEKNLERWIGKVKNYQKVNGIMIPTKIEGSWMIDDYEYNYARFHVTEFEFDKRIKQSHQ